MSPLPKSPEHSAALRKAAVMRMRLERAYQIIRDARAWARDNRVAKKLEASTRKMYLDEALRLIDGAKSVADVWTAAADTTRPSVFRRRRASLRFAVHHELSTQDALQQDQDNPDPRWFASISALANYLAIMKGVPPENKVPIEKRTPRKSKRTVVRKLPEGWHAKLLSKVPEQYSLVSLVNAVTGCRPAEIHRGVEIWVDGDILVTRILGAKLKENAGLPWRELEWDLKDAHEIVQRLAQLVDAGDGRMTVGLADPKRYSSAVRTAGRRAWPKRSESVTPYCFRHASASAGKSTMSREDVAVQMGHQSTATASTYGAASMGRKTQGLAPNRVRTAPEFKVRDKIKSPPNRRSGPVPGT